MAEKIVTIFGTARAKPGQPIYSTAYELGREMAEQGWVVANGGYGGTMEAAAKGARDAGGRTIGVTCRSFGGSKANEYISREISTDTIDERLDTLISLGKAYVVLPGGTGTLLELAKVWELKNKGFLESGKPIILVGEFWKPLVDLVGSDDPAGPGGVQWVDEPKQAGEILAGWI